jgi:hypothetical protein
MGQLRLYVQILRALEEVDPDSGGAIFENCKHRTVICNEDLTRDTIENKLRPLLPSEGMFLNDRTVTHLWDEEGTSCGLFAGSVFSLSELYASISKWVKDGDCSCHYCKHAIHHLHETISVSGATSIFHLAIRCDSRMVSLIKHMQTLDNIELTSTTSDWHSLLNADGAPCLHIAANLHKPAIIEGLLLQKPETLNESFGSRAYTLMLVIADSGQRYPRNIIEFLMSEVRSPRVDMYARDLKERTPLEIAFSRHFINAESIYNLLSPHDHDRLDHGQLLSRIARNNGHKIQHKVDMIKLITTDRKIDMANARSNPYNAAIDSVAGNWNEKSTNTAIKMWEALIANRVPMNHFDDHGTTALAHAIENASSAFLEVLDDMAEIEIEQLGLNFLTVDKDGDTPHTLAQQSDDRSKLDIIERYIKKQSRRPIPDHDPRSAAMAYFINNDFEQCLQYLDQLPESAWRQVMKARSHLGLSQCNLALEAICNLEDCGIVQHLKGSIFIKAQDYKKALHFIHDADSKEVRSLERKKLQRRYCCMVLSLVSVSRHLPFLPYELRMYICNTEAE